MKRYSTPSYAEIVLYHYIKYVMHKEARQYNPNFQKYIDFIDRGIDLNNYIEFNDIKENINF